MKKAIPFLLAAILTACGQSETPQKAISSEPDILTLNVARSRIRSVACVLRPQFGIDDVHLARHLSKRLLARHQLAVPSERVDSIAGGCRDILKIYRNA